MSDISVEEYKKFIDALVGIIKKPSTAIRRIQTGKDGCAERPNSEKQREDAIIASFSPEQKEIVLELLLGERQVTIEEILEYFTWKKYQINHNALPLAIEPFDSASSSDVASRLEGESWPDEDSATHE